MAPVADNITGRYWLDYVAGTGGVEHTLQVRFRGATPDFSDVEGWLFNFLTAIEPALADGWRPLRARWAAEGSDISLPYSMEPALANFVANGAGAMVPREAPREARWLGRSPVSGRRVSLSVYGWVGNTPANYRLGPGESALVSPDAFTALDGSPDIFLVADNTKPVWYRYVSVNYNSYWEQRARVS